MSNQSKSNKVLQIFVWDLYGICSSAVHGIWGMREIWDMRPIFLHTEMGFPKMYGVLESMGFEGYGLGGSRLY